MKNKLEIVKYVGSHKKPFRIVETYECVDGFRSRLTNKCFATLEEALVFILES